MRRLLITFLLLTFAATGLGNTVPAAPVGPHVQPLDSTTVRLAEERIEIHLRRDTRYDAYFSTNAVAEYRIWFRFEPEADEQMTVGFPLSIYDPKHGIYGDQAANLRVEIDGREVDVQIRRSDPKQDPDAYFASWALFPVTFQAGRPLEMVVSYTMHVLPYGKAYGAPLWVAYVLRTGAHWAGTIGRSEAVLTMDRPIREEDVRAEVEDFRSTTPGWVLEDGALRWVWEDFEPDFDLHLVLDNPYWRDTAEEIQAMLDAGVHEADPLIAVMTATRSLAEAGNIGMMSPLRDGSPPGEAAERLTPAVLAAAESFLAEHPEEDEVRTHYLLLLREAAVPLRWDPAGNWVWSLRSEERLARFLREAVAHDMIDRLSLWEWRPWLEGDLEGYPWRTETREAIAAFLRSVMPDSFESEETARLWVAHHAGHALAPEQVDRLFAEAVSRISPGGASGAAPGPAPAESNTAGEGAGAGGAETSSGEGGAGGAEARSRERRSGGEEAEGSQDGAGGWSAVSWGGAAALLIAIGRTVFLLRRRRAHRKGSRG